MPKNGRCKLTKDLRFRLTLSYAVFFALLLGGALIGAHAILGASQTANLRDNIDREWAAVKGYLQINNGRVAWYFDREDPDQSRAVSDLQRVFQLTDRKGSVLLISDVYAALDTNLPGEASAAVLQR